MKISLSYLRFVFLAAVVPSLSCCMSDADIPGHMSDVIISGTVFDYDDRSGVADMKIVFTAYESGDTSFEYPISEDVACTGTDGSYSINTVSMTDGWKFRITVSDNDPERPGGGYVLSSSFDPVLHVELNRHSFDKESSGFRIGPVDIPVARAAD